MARITSGFVPLRYNGTIFAYGQTGAGKSFSMMGDTSDPELYGARAHNMDYPRTRWP